MEDGKSVKEEEKIIEEEEEEEGPRMGELIREAMPCKLSRRSSMDPSLANTFNSERTHKARHLARSTSLSDKEVQGFQDLGFTFEKHHLSSTATTDVAPSSAQTSSQHLKAHIKYWARSVASNMQ